MLWCLAALLSSLSILVVLADVFSKRFSGFSITILNQTVLTYMPTALLLVILAAWRQADLGCKLSAAWIELSKGHAPASRSVLLDYISTFQLLSFYQSIRNGHVAVALGVLGFVFLKIATIASTGLFTLRSRTSTLVHPITLGHNFNGSLYDSSDLNLLQDQSPVFTAYGIMAANLGSPFGTSASAAYPAFQLTEIAKMGNENTTYAVTMDAVFPEITCKAVDASVELLPSNLTITIANPQHQIRLISQECDNNPGPILALNPAKYLCPSRQLSGTIYQIGCKNDKGMETDNWRLITMTDIRYEQSINQSEPVGPQREVSTMNSSTAVADVRSILCQVSYSTGKLNVTGRTAAFPTGLNFTRTSDSADGQLDDFSESDFSEMINGATAAASDIFLISDDDEFAEEVPDTLLKMMASHANNSYAALFDNETLVATAETAFTHIAVQAVSRYLRPSRSIESTASVFVEDESVQVTELSAWLMFGAFLSAALISLVLIVIRAASASSVRARTLLDMSILTRRSSSLWPLLTNTRRHDEAWASKYLGTYWFCAAFDHVDQSFAVAAIPSKNHSDHAEQCANDEDERWWKQITVSYWFLGLTFIYGAALIIVLEVLQRLSQSRGGIERLATNSDLFRTVITHYLPALVVILLATMFNCLDFNVLLLYPYHQLRTGLTRSSLGLRPPFQQLPLVSFSRALLKLEYAVLGSSSAAFVGALLTIVVSGLFTIESIPTIMETKFNALDVVTGDWTNSVTDDGGAAILTSLTESSNLTYPVGTYEEIAIPTVHFPDIGKTRLSPSAISMTVPMVAYQGNLTCETAASGAYNITIQNTSFEHVATIRSTYPLPSNCLRGGPGGDDSELSFKQEFRFPLNDTESYLAKLLDLHVGPYRDGGFADSQGEIFPSNNPDNPAGCPSLALIYGYLGPDDLSQSAPEGQNIAVQVCYQELNRIRMNVSLEGTDMHISASKPPLATKSNAQKMRVSGSNETAFSFRIQAHLDNALSFFNNTENQFASVSGVKIVDRFFQGIFFGRNSIPLKTMKLANQSDRDLVAASILSLYRRYMAQVMSAKMKTKVAQLTATQVQDHADELSFQGVITAGLTEDRFIQHETPKLILQSMIAFMLVGGILAVSSMKLVDILPANANPCTIWGQLGLWEGSRWCDGVHSDGHDTTVLATKSKEMSINVVVSDLESETVACQSLFKLDWWTTKGTDGQLSRRYGVDVLPLG